jgi:hypothetical protein
VEQPPVALVEPPGAVGLRHERVEAEQDPQAEDRQGHEETAADADGADGFRTEAADHERVDHAHEHPAEFGEHDRRGKAQHRAELRTNA